MFNEIIPEYNIGTDKLIKFKIFKQDYYELLSVIKSKGYSCTINEKAIKWDSVSFYIDSDYNRLMYDNANWNNGEYKELGLITGDKIISGLMEALNEQI